MADVIAINRDEKEDATSMVIVKRTSSAGWTVGHDSDFEIGGEEELTLPGDTVLSDAFEVPETVRRIRVEVSNFQDGRSFSLIRQLREKIEYTRSILVVGQISPAQLLHMSELGADQFAFDSDETALASQRILKKRDSRFRYRENYTLRRIHK